MTSQLENLSQEVKGLTEVLAFNGLNLVSQENIRQMEMFLQQASQMQAFRLATSLRYLHIELKRFMAHHPAFNIERYVFFLNNCWLLSSAFLSQNKIGRGSEDIHVEELLGKQSEPTDVKKMELRLVGLEKVNLEGALFGMIYHFISKNHKITENVIKLSILQQPKGLSNPEILLGINIPGTQPPIPFFKILRKDITIKNVKYHDREDMILITKEPYPSFSIQTGNTDDADPLPAGIFDGYDLDLKAIISQISSQKVTPFDASVMNIGYLYVKKVSITAQYKEGTEKGYYQTAAHVFNVAHERGYPLFIRFQDKPVNSILVTNMEKMMEHKSEIEGMFGKLTIERGMLSLFPLACLDEKGIWFPCISRDLKLSNKEILQDLYKQTKQAS